ncbi:hypothetical protein HF1_10680 [Mycoplasma haemofelis str. Langford 1]|uniref:Uncharacterized protein n=1 Tax=Mycoplasma haemofelis (strain Langford 1) TaxID=941640 RepID=E8ZIV5_MYCHL|nr:hypothetical protein [Mycoplasma haemofelis]CBY93076.1 hypothetical protein HF1_10680 [Mycoplasma haemofelis str. Langford 1]
MSYTFAKIATIGGATTAAGGSVAAKAFLFPTSDDGVSTSYVKTANKEEELTEEQQSEVVAEEKEIARSVESKTEGEPSVQQDIPKVEEIVSPKEKSKEVVSPQCFIYEVKTPIRERDGSRKIKEILRRVEEGKETFLRTGKGWKSSTFKYEINKACPNDLKVSKNVYVWLDGGAWQYSSGLQNPDWLKEADVKKPDNLKTN